MKVVLLKGKSKYGALRCYIDELAKAFVAHGDTPVIVDTQDQDIFDNFAAVLEQQRPADLVFSFSILGEFVDERGRSTADIVGAPHVIQFVDYPFCHLGRLLGLPRSTAVLTIDASHVRVINGFFGSNHFAHVGFCPVAALGEPVELPDSADAYLAARPVQVLCAQSYFAPGLPPWRDYPALIGTIFSEAAEMALAEEWVSPLEVLDRCMLAHGLDFTDPALRTDLAIVRTQSVEINEWVRSLRRAEFFAAAAKVGLPLTAYGTGYDAILERYKNIDYRGLGDTLGTPERMRRSRLVISHNSNFGEGVHDRVPSGMLAGAAVASDTSKYYREHYVAGRDIALFRWRHLEEDLAAIKALLGDGDALLAMAKAGQQKALGQDRWEHRIDTILAAGQAAAAARARTATA